MFEHGEFGLAGGLTSELLMVFDLGHVIAILDIRVLWICAVLYRFSKSNPVLESALLESVRERVIVDSGVLFSMLH